MKRTESRPLSTTPTKSEVKSRLMRMLRSKIDLTTSRKAEKLERKSIWRETRSKTSRLPKYRSLRMQV